MEVAKTGVEAFSFLSLILQLPVSTILKMIGYPNFRWVGVRKSGMVVGFTPKETTTHVP